jgi:hypothetical protein
MKLTISNKGICEPEMRLVAMIPYVLIMILGNVIDGVAHQNSWDWRIIVIIGYKCDGIQVAAIPGIASTCAVDSYKPVTGSIFVVIAVNKNLWGYGFFEIHHALDHLERLYRAHHVQHAAHDSLVLIRHPVLVLQQDI